jgi:glycosyltransferase involved in cell wall biosynthesis
MRVALDATPLTLSSGGLARYTARIAVALAAEFPGDRFILLSDQPFSLPPDAPPALEKGAGPRDVLEQRWWLWGLARELARQRADLFHGPDFAVPYLPLRPSVMTLHDLSPWMDPSWHAHAGRVRRRTPWLARLGLATMILTDSEAVRRQAIAHFGLPPGRVAAVPLAADAQFRPSRSHAPPSVRYFLFVGTLEPRKNLRFLIRAWQPVYLSHGVELWLAGRRRQDEPVPPDLPGLRWLGEVPDERLPGLYSNALAFVYPSLYEGFGLPVLEAMQCGACVIVSNDPSLGEVAGDAAVRLDPQDLRAWTQAMAACAEGSHRIEDFRRRSTQRARLFSWSRTARLTREVYEEAQRRFGR